MRPLKAWLGPVKAWLELVRAWFGPLRAWLAPLSPRMGPKLGLRGDICTDGQMDGWKEFLHNPPATRVALLTSLLLSFCLSLHQSSFYSISFPSFNHDLSIYEWVKTEENLMKVDFF